MDRETPNILIFIADQLNGTLFPDRPADFLHVPHLRSLAERSVRFANAYTPSALCAPARAAFMTGRLPSRTGVYDNAAEFRSDEPTFVHQLRSRDYRTILSGKMHFVGADQMHGFEERLTTDLYPADFGWTPDWTRPDERIDWWYHTLGSVLDAGTAEVTNQIEYDDEVAYHARLRLQQLVREKERRPWCMTVSFSHPHDPYVARQHHWDLYADCPALDPKVPESPRAEQDPHSLRLLQAINRDAFDIRPEHVRAARQAYFACISYIDDQIGAILETLRSCCMADNTRILFLSDHGDMIGERGMWFKMSFYEGSSRVPLMWAEPGLPGRSIDTPVSTLDVAASLTELAGGAPLPGSDGASLVGLLRGEEREIHPPVAMEYAAEGTSAPLVALRHGRYKFCHCETDPPQLFDLESDPDEMQNLAEDPAHAGRVEWFREEIARRWDLAAFDRGVRESQARRKLVYQALRNGAYFPWDFQPLQKASERYMRNHLDLNEFDASARFPPRE